MCQVSCEFFSHKSSSVYNILYSGNKRKLDEVQPAQKRQKHVEEEADEGEEEIGGNESFFSEDSDAEEYDEACRVRLHSNSLTHTAHLHYLLYILQKLNLNPHYWRGWEVTAKSPLPSRNEPFPLEFKSFLVY